MNQKKSESDLPVQKSEKLAYSTPILTEFGEISSVVQFNRGNGFDASGGFPNDTRS